MTENKQKVCINFPKKLGYLCSKANHICRMYGDQFMNDAQIKNGYITGEDIFVLAAERVRV